LVIASDSDPGRTGSWLSSDNGETKGPETSGGSAVLERDKPLSLLVETLRSSTWEKSRCFATTAEAPGKKLSQSGKRPTVCGSGGAERREEAS
jgi:hypothetical protein